MHSRNWNDLQYVLAVAESGSLAAASRRLGVHHATVLRRITAFEDACGIRIFERASKGYHLTPESIHILETVKAISVMIEGLGRSIASQSQAIKGPLKITTTDSLCQAVVLKHVENFSQEYPGIQVDLLSRNYHLDFSKMEADITIRPAHSLPADLTGKKVCDLGLRAYASHSLLQTDTDRNPAHYMWIGVSGPLTKAPFHDWLSSKVPRENFLLLTDSFIAALSAVESGRGAAFLPCCLGDRSSKIAQIQSIPEYFSTGIWVATHSDRVRSPLIQTAVTYFTEALSSEKELLEG